MHFCPLFVPSNRRIENNNNVVQPPPQWWISFLITYKKKKRTTKIPTSCVYCLPWLQMLFLHFWMSHLLTCTFQFSVSLLPPSSPSQHQVGGGQSIGGPRKCICFPESSTDYKGEGKGLWQASLPAADTTCSIFSHQGLVTALEHTAWADKPHAFYFLVVKGVRKLFLF